MRHQVVTRDSVRGPIEEAGNEEFKVVNGPIAENCRLQPTDPCLVVRAPAVGAGALFAFIKQTVSIDFIFFTVLHH
jgi:hypothetical protein